MFRKVEDFNTFIVLPSSHSLLSEVAGGSGENPFLARAVKHQRLVFPYLCVVQVMKYLDR